MVRALIDLGASDSFMHVEIARDLGLYRYLLAVPLTVRVANGEALPVTHFVRLTGRLGLMPIWLFLLVIGTTIPVVLGYHFWDKQNLQVYWRGRWVRVERKWTVFKITALPPADSF